MDTKERLNAALRFANGAAFIPAFYHTAPPNLEESNRIPDHYQPLLPFPAVLPTGDLILTPRQLAGDMVTEKLLDAHGPTGEAIYISDGFNTTLADTPIGPVRIFIDTKTDRILAGIIHEAQTLFQTHPEWSTDRRVFELSLLCFGDWGQKRYPMESLKNLFSTPNIVLGELIWTTNVSDQECSPKSLAMQVTGQACGLGISWHEGVGARFSPYCHGEGPHAWNLVRDGSKKLVVDWTNYPPSIARLFASVKTIKSNELYEEFCKKYGAFSEFRHEKYPPTQDQYFDLQSGEHLEYAARNSVVYWNGKDEYLGSCSLPAGWES
jgi:hypothetical protein